jgi:hypothetical protein
MLPEISVINQPATLIVSQLSFQSGNRITLLIDDQEEQGQLLKKMTATGSINQVSIKLQSRPDAKISTNRPDPAANEDEFIRSGPRCNARRLFVPDCVIVAQCVLT